MKTFRVFIAALRGHYGPPAAPPPGDAFERVLYENVAYLAPPAKRREAFALLRKTIGTKPAEILKAKKADLEKVTAKGILKAAFAAKLKACARIAMEEFGGDLEKAVASPLPAAKRALRKFPGIGEPGAEKILLFTGRHALLAPESNGLRVLVRLGLVRDEGAYAKTYAAAREVIKDFPANPKALREAHLLLHQHGLTLCKRSAPRCGECPLARGCDFARDSNRRDS